MDVQQMRAARAALRWSIEDLSAASGVSVRTIKMIETGPDKPESKQSTIKKLKVAFESAGIEFIGTPDDAPGIRIHQRKDNA